METKDVTHWQSFTYRDAAAMATWLGAIGFTEHATYRDEQDPTVVHHAEWVGHGSGIMFGSERPGALCPVGQSGAYLVVDDPDALFDAAVAAGATVVQAMVDQDYDGRGGTVQDPEGHYWSFGSYQPS